MLDVQGDRRQRSGDVQPVSDLADPRVADLESADPHQDEPGRQDHEGGDQQGEPVSDGAAVGPPPRGSQVREAEDHEGNDEQEPQQQMQDNHQHVEESLLRGSEVPCQSGHAGQIQPVGAQHGEADEDHP